MKTARYIVVVASVILLSVSVAAAQSYEPQQYLQLVRVHVKPGANVQFEDYIKKLAEGAEKIGAPQQWIGNQVVLGGRGNTYIFALLYDKWEEMDSWEAIPQILVKAFGEKDGAQILRSGTSAIEESYTRAYRYLPDQSSTLTTAPTDAKALRMSVTTVKPNKIFDYDAAMIKAREAANKTPNAPKTIRRVSVDGPSFTYLSVIPMKSYSERDSWLGPGAPIMQVYGEYEGRKIIDTILGSIESNMSVVFVPRADLSRMPTGSTSN